MSDDNGVTQISIECTGANGKTVGFRETFTCDERTDLAFLEQSLGMLTDSLRKKMQIKLAVVLDHDTDQCPVCKETLEYRFTVGLYRYDQKQEYREDGGLVDATIGDCTKPTNRFGLHQCPKCWSTFMVEMGD